MIKSARKPSSDPVQEKLRQNKAVWNKDVSVFINDLIHLKKTMNGWPSKFHQERSFIKDPIPADPASIIGVLAEDFQQLAQRANGIVQEQVEYSKNRRKRQPKQLNLPLGAPQPKAPEEPAAPQPDLSQQLSLPHTASAEAELIKVASVFEQKYTIEKEASNPVTRFFTRLFNPTIGFGSSADIRRARIAMLNSAADTYKGLGKFQVLVVKSSKDSVHDAKKKLDEIYNHWNLVSRGYVIYKSSKAINNPDKGGDIEAQIKKEDEKDEKELEGIDKEMQAIQKQLNGKQQNDNPMLPQAPPSPMPNIDGVVARERAKKMIADFRNYQHAVSGCHAQGYLYELGGAIDRMIATKGKDVHPDFETFYVKSLKYCNEELGTTGLSFREIDAQLRARVKNQIKNEKPPVHYVVPQKPQQPAPDSLPDPDTKPSAGITQAEEQISSIEKVAQDFLKRWVGKTSHQFSLFDKTSTNRLHCYNMAGQLRKETDKLMDVLEKGLDEEQLDPLMRDINTKMLSLRGLMRTLHMSLPVEKKK